MSKSLTRQTYKMMYKFTKKLPPIFIYICELTWNIKYNVYSSCIRTIISQIYVVVKDSGHRKKRSRMHMNGGVN